MPFVAYTITCSTALNPKRPLHLLQCYCHVAMATTPAASDWLCAVSTHRVDADMSHMQREKRLCCGL